MIITYNKQGQLVISRDAVPDGAEKFLDLSRFKVGRHEFYKVVKGRIWYFDYDDKVWAKAIMKENYNKAIELPEEEDNQEWVPEVGVECEGKLHDEANNFSYIKVNPLYDFDGEWAVQKVDTGTLAYCDEFRPLKTQKEIDRGLFVDMAVRGISVPVSDLGVAAKVISQMFDAGFKAPKGDL